MHLPTECGFSADSKDVNTEFGISPMLLSNLQRYSSPNLEWNKRLIAIKAKCFKYSLFIIKLNIMTKKWEISTSQYLDSVTFRRR